MVLETLSANYTGWPFPLYYYPTKVQKILKPPNILKEIFKNYLKEIICKIKDVYAKK
jgi:hypothetical protein